MVTILTQFVSRPKPSPFIAYTATTLITVFVLVVQVALSPKLDDCPLLLFALPVIIASFVFDAGTGFYATGLGTLLGIVLARGPSWSLAPLHSDELLELTIFFVIGCSSAAAVEALRTALTRVVGRERSKGVLLRELNHRVRNDLQTLSALLRVSARANMAARPFLQDAADRIVVMGRVYDRLGNHDGPGTVPAKEFLEGLVEDLQKGLAELRPVGLFVQASELDITVKCATAVGLIVNELVTNAIKYAFPNGRSGSINVTFAQSDDVLVLTVEDDGVGMPPDPIPQGTGLGQKLVEQLVAQNQGTITINNAGGVRATIRLPLGGCSP